MVYRLNNYYFIGWMVKVKALLYGDKCEFDENKKLRDPNVKSILPTMLKAESLGFVRYDHLPMETFQLIYVKILLKSQKSAGSGRKRAIDNIYYIRGFAILSVEKACRIANNNITPSLKEYIL